MTSAPVNSVCWQSRSRICIGHTYLHRQRLKCFQGRKYFIRVRAFKLELQRPSKPASVDTEGQLVRESEKEPQQKEHNFNLSENRIVQKRTLQEVLLKNQLLSQNGKSSSSPPLPPNGMGTEEKNAWETRRFEKKLQSLYSPPKSSRASSYNKQESGTTLTRLTAQTLNNMRKKDKKKKAEIDDALKNMHPNQPKPVVQLQQNTVFQAHLNSFKNSDISSDCQGEIPIIQQNCEVSQTPSCDAPKKLQVSQDYITRLQGKDVHRLINQQKHSTSDGKILSSQDASLQAFTTQGNAVVSSYSISNTSSVQQDGFNKQFKRKGAKQQQIESQQLQQQQHQTTVSEGGVDEKLKSKNLTKKNQFQIVETMSSQVKQPQTNMSGQSRSQNTPQLKYLETSDQHKSDKHNPAKKQKNKQSKKKQSKHKIKGVVQKSDLTGQKVPQNQQQKHSPNADTSKQNQHNVLVQSINPSDQKKQSSHVQAGPTNQNPADQKSSEIQSSSDEKFEKCGPGQQLVQDPQKFMQRVMGGLMIETEAAIQADVSEMEGGQVVNDHNSDFVVVQSSFEEQGQQNSQLQSEGSELDQKVDNLTQQKPQIQLDNKNLQTPLPSSQPLLGDIYKIKSKFSANRISDNDQKQDTESNVAGPELGDVQPLSSVFTTEEASFLEDYFVYTVSSYLDSYVPKIWNQLLHMPKHERIDWSSQSVPELWKDLLEQNGPEKKLLHAQKLPVFWQKLLHPGTPNSSLISQNFEISNARKVQEQKFDANLDVCKAAEEIRAIASNYIVSRRAESESKSVTEKVMPHNLQTDFSTNSATQSPQDSKINEKTVSKKSSVQNQTDSVPEFQNIDKMQKSKNNDVQKMLTKSQNQQVHDANQHMQQAVPAYSPQSSIMHNKLTCVQQNGKSQEQPSEQLSSSQGPNILRNEVNDQSQSLNLANSVVLTPIPENDLFCISESDTGKQNEQEFVAKTQYQMQQSSRKQAMSKFLESNNKVSQLQKLGEKLIDKNQQLNIFDKDTEDIQKRVNQLNNQNQYGQLINNTNDKEFLDVDDLWSQYQQTNLKYLQEQSPKQSRIDKFLGEKQQSKQEKTVPHMQQQILDTTSDGHFSPQKLKNQGQQKDIGLKKEKADNNSGNQKFSQRILPLEFPFQKGDVVVGKVQSVGEFSASIKIKGYPQLFGKVPFSHASPYSINFVDSAGSSKMDLLAVGVVRQFKVIRIPDYQQIQKGLGPLLSAHDLDLVVMRKRVQGIVQMCVKYNQMLDMAVTKVEEDGLIGIVAGIAAFVPIQQIPPPTTYNVDGGEQDKWSGEKLNGVFLAEDCSVKVVPFSSPLQVVPYDHPSPHPHSHSNTKYRRTYDLQFICSITKAYEFKALEELQVGTLVDGKIGNIEDFGVFVELQGYGVTGLLKAQNVSGKSFNNLSDCFEVGESVRSCVVAIEYTDKPRITLSTRVLEKQKGDILERKQWVFDNAHVTVLPYLKNLERIQASMGYNQS